MSRDVPPGWPATVHPPGSERFEETAVAWLLEHVPPDYRLYEVLRRYPVVLARMARQHLWACVKASRDGFATARLDLRGYIPVHAVEAVLDAYRSEGRRLVAAARAAELLEETFHGKEFQAKL